MHYGGREHPLSFDAKAHSRMSASIADLCGSDQPELIQAAVCVLEGLANGAIAINHLRIFPGSATDLLHGILRRKSVEQMKGNRQ